MEKSQFKEIPSWIPTGGRKKYLALKYIVWKFDEQLTGKKHLIDKNILHRKSNAAKVKKIRIPNNKHFFGIPISYFWDQTTNDREMNGLLYFKHHEMVLKEVSCK